MSTEKNLEREQFKQEISKRLKILIDDGPLSRPEVAKLTGIKPNRLSEYISGKKLLGVNNASSLKRAFPLLSYDWLFAGIGEMFPKGARSRLIKEEQPDETRDGYQPQTKAPLSDRAKKYLEQAAWVLTTKNKYARLLELAIETHLIESVDEQQKRGEPLPDLRILEGAGLELITNNTGTDPHGR